MIEIKRTNGAAFGSVQPQKGHEKMGQKCDIFSVPPNGKAPPFLLGEALGSGRGLQCAGVILFPGRNLSLS